MLILATLLNMVAAAGLAAMALKYLRGPAPADYHAEVLKKAKVEITQEVTDVFAAINKVYGAAFMALAIVLVFVSLFGVLQGLVWAKLLVLVSSLVAGIPAAMAARGVEQKTGVRTPWRVAVGLCAIVVLAFLVSLTGS